MSQFKRWVGESHTMRYQAHYQIGGMGHMYRKRYESFPTLWPMRRMLGWVDRVSTPLCDAELVAVRLSAQRCEPSGNHDGVESVAHRLNRESNPRPCGRKRVRFPK